ncbi:ATP-binding protein [Pseudoalteromonas rubra]|uniref:sensor histidine kinase n=1 Tax=Pseudoalteromonas rubra TaxID=43658 RepID=UPI002DB66D26|nr:ATP-binding protein [Pseudoalteromonas rubra]MEC4091870.1 ATP-binding protein [Pseudoalteromonas rubra]
MERLLLLLFINIFILSANCEAFEPAGYTYGVTQDEGNYVYQATQTGGFRFDGTHHIALNALYDLPHNWVKDVEIHNGSLLIAMGADGIYKADLSSNHSEKLTDLPCWQMALSSEILLCKNSSDLISLKISQEGVSNYSLLLNPETIVNAITGKYLDTDKGLFKIEGTSIVEMDPKPSRFSRLASNSHGLVAWRDGILFFYDNHGTVKSFEWSSYPSALAIDGSTALIADNGIVSRISLFDFSVINKGINTQRYPIKKIFLDNESNIWLVSNNSIEVIASFTSHVAAPLPSAYNIPIKKDGLEFLGTEKGVFYKEGASFVLLDDPKNYGYTVTDLRRIGNKLYIATTKGLAEYDVLKKTLRKIYLGYVIVLENINGTLHVGTNDDGLLQVVDGQAVPMNDINAVMNTKEVVSIAEIDGTLYIGTGIGFYTKSRDGAIAGFGENLRTVTGFVTTDSKVYIGTFGQGLFEFRDELLIRVNTPQSIADLIEVNGSIYLGTIAGLYEYKSEVSLVPGTNKLNVTPNSLTIENGRLKFGNQHGYDQVALTGNLATLAKPLLAGVESNGIFTKQVNKSLAADMQHRFYLATNTYLQRTHFQYKILDEWVDAKNGVIELFHIQPGNYELSFRARQVGSIWSEAEKVRVTFEGKWYQTFTFYVALSLVVVMVICCVLGAFVLHLRASYRVHEKLHKVYSFTNTHNVLAMMTKAKSRFSSPDVNKHADGLVFIDEAIDVLVPIAHGNAVLGKRSLKQGVEALKASFKYESPSSSFEFVCSTDQGKALPASIERDAYAVIFHSVKNAVQHGRSKHVEVFVEQVRGVLHVSILDNGIGCSWYRRTFNYGLGLFLIKQIAKAYRTKLRVRSGKKGTSIALCFPLHEKKLNGNREAQDIETTFK